MSIVDRVEIHQFAYVTPDLGADAGGFNFVYEPGGKLRMTRYAIRVQTKDGSVGEYVTMWGGSGMALTQTRMLAANLVGRNALQREQIYDEFRRGLRQFDHMGHGPLDIALWDLAGKRYGASVAELLGGYRMKLPAYASTYLGDHNGGLDSPEAYADFAEACYEMGYRAFKMHGWSDGNVARECATVRALGKRVGGRMALMNDPSCELRTFADALAVGRACDDAGFYWYEDPMREMGVSQHAHRKLRQMMKTPILQCEHVRTLEQKADFIAAEATDFVRVDPEYDCGITGTMKTAHLAEAFGLDCEIHAPGPAHRACMSAMRNSNWYEVALVGPKVGNALPPVYACGYSDQLDCIDENGCVDVPTGPGLGVTYDWDFITKNRVKLWTFGREK